MKLPLATDIADRVVDAQSNNTLLDVSAQANELVTMHPEAEASVAEVEETLRDELDATRVSTRPLPKTV